MAQLAQAVKSVLYFVILIAFTDMIMPNARYKKYIKMVMGLILILMILTPLTGFLGGKGAGFDSGGALAGLRAAESRAGAGNPELDAQWQAMLKSAFDEQVRAQLGSLAKDEGFDLLSAQIETDADMSRIIRIDADVSEAEQAEPEKKGFIRIEPVVVGGGAGEEDASVAERLKKSVADFYKLSADNINIIVRKKS